MTINKINSGSYSEKDVKKSSSSRSTDATGSAGEASSSQAPKAKGDQISLSGSFFKGDFDFARKELAKLGGNNSFSNLREVKQKIERGEYDKQEVHEKIGSLMGKDLASLEKVISRAPQSEEPAEGAPKKLTAEYKEYLIENPKVVQKVVDQVMEDLRKL